MKRPFAVAVASWSLLAVPVVLLVLLAILTIAAAVHPEASPGS